MSVYKVAPSDSASQSIVSTSSDGSLASHPPAQTKIASPHNSGAPFTESNDIVTRGTKSPGVITAVTLGSVSGIVGLLVLLLVAARRCTKRRQIQRATTEEQNDTGEIPASDNTSSTERRSTAANAHDAASNRDAVRNDLRRLDGMIMGQHSPSPRLASNSQIGVAATTGTDWKKDGTSPLTPRASKQVDVVGDERQPSTTPVVVHPRETAPVRGWGEKAWHRRRLSAPSPPAEVMNDGGASVEGGKRDDRRALPSQLSGGMSAVDATGIPTSRGGQEAVSAVSEEGTVSSSPSWRWTVSTASEISEAGAQDERADKAA